MPLVTKEGFKSLPEQAFLGIEELAHAGGGDGLEISADTEVASILDALGHVGLIRIKFDSFSDGRGFSLARSLRNYGYRGRLRASGHLISDQFRYALACGFDEVEINDELAARQPVADWLAGQVAAASYRDKLAGRAENATRSPVQSEAQRFSAYEPSPGIFEQHVTSVTHYTDSLFSFRISRPASFRFRSGEFAMIGLPNATSPVFRAYSVASPAWDDELEFYSIKVPKGPLTQNLQRIKIGDTVLLNKKATGTLVLDALTPGRRLFLFSTGTGIAPFASIIRDPETYEKFEQVIVTHTCRTTAELIYGRQVVAQTRLDPIIGELAGEDRLVHITTLTREPHPLEGRITTLLNSGALFDAIDRSPIDPSHDRAMICGSTAMLQDVRLVCERFGLEEGSNSRPGSYVLERAFVD